MLAAEYVLGAMPADERQVFRDRVEREPELATEVRFWSERLVSLTNDIEAIAPPADLFRKLEKRLFAEGQETPITSFKQFWNSLAVWRGLAMATIAAFIIAVAASIMDRPTTSIDFVAEVSGARSDVKLLAIYDGESGELRLNRLSGVAPGGRSLELWLIAGKDAPVSLGLLPEATSTRIAVPASLRPRLENATLAISDEPSGGSPTGLPTGEVLASGSLSAI